MGGTLVARIAGRRLAPTVTMMPTTSATMIVRVSKMRPLFGSVKPIASKSQKSPLASASPRKRPTIEARTPTTTDSRRIDLRTCRREAPTVRRVASSRVRCAIVIESEFAITKAPTKSAMPPKERRNVRRKRDELVRVLRVVLRLLGAGPHLSVLGEDGPELLARAACRRPRCSPRRRSRRASRPGEDLLRGREVEAGKRGAADRRDRAEFHDARDAEVLDRAAALNADGVADLESLLVGGRAVDHHLVSRAATHPRRA